MTDCPNAGVPTAGPRNPYLADSGYSIAHGRCDQQDNSPLAGPMGPSEVLDEDDVRYSWLGPGHFGGMISSPYPDGSRVIWSNGREVIAKLDYETLDVLATLPVGDGTVTPVSELETMVDGLDSSHGADAIEHALGLTLRFMMGLDGVYALVDRYNTLFVGRRTHAVAYTESDPTDPASPVVERARWEKPEHIVGSFVGMNMSFDGRLVLTTDHGWVVALDRDFARYDAIQLPGAVEEAAAHCARMEADRGNTAYGWVRTSCCVDDADGIYVSSVDHAHKVVWTGERLSVDPADGAWSAAYRNGAGFGSGTTPSLMGFGSAEDHFVVIGDGDDVVNITLLWRDEIPDDWVGLANAPSRRIAGLGPANMGDPDAVAIQTEQSITVSGYGAMTVNNEPATVPEGFPEQGLRMLVFFLGHDPAYTPHGLHKYEWDPKTRELREAWVNTDVSSPNSVPFVSQASNIVYTCGARDGRWTIEAVDWSTGRSAFHYVLGSSKFNTLGAGVTLDDDGRLLFGTIFGKTRILR
ncbi:MAG: hypothetical protein MUP97_01130 [Acidimicrobiia bacterium]|nr:hypothetical protein [Acidimicrobiia bacterium]